MSGRALMVQGTTSWAGKSLVTTALCRSFARRGVRVAPFKAQNMSNNARVVDGGEIGAAQHLQALAAQVAPDVRMNPVLLKPESHTSSQVVVNGVYDPELSRREWRGRSEQLWPVVQDALRALQAQFDLVVIEGAGSPAEINLTASDIVNMRVAHEADAPVLLVADIDRGGAFAHLYGTWAMLDDAARARVRGFVLNRFRGDATLLAPGPAMLEQRTGVPTIGVLPWLEHGLPDEDGGGHRDVSRRDDRRGVPRRGDRPIVGIVLYPTASNLDEYRLLEQVADITWVREPASVRDVDLLVLPGSKHVVGDLAWLRTQGLDRAIRGRVDAGGRVLGVCGGLQMLGVGIDDAAGVDGTADALGVLPLRTTFAADKRTAGVAATFEPIGGPWSILGGCAVSGYEIRHGHTVVEAGPEVTAYTEVTVHTEVTADTAVTAHTEVALRNGLGWVRGPVLGIYLHGLLESTTVLARLFDAAPARTLDDTFELLADAVDEHLDMAFVDELVGR